MLYISVITNPTLGGVSASFASLVDIFIAKEGSIYGFCGKGIIEKTTCELLPDDFQTAKYARNHGVADIVENKENINAYDNKNFEVT